MTRFRRSLDDAERDHAAPGASPTFAKSGLFLVRLLVGLQQPRWQANNGREPSVCHHPPIRTEQTPNNPLQANNFRMKPTPQANQSPYK